MKTFIDTVLGIVGIGLFFFGMGLALQGYVWVSMVIVFLMSHILYWGLVVPYEMITELLTLVF